MTRLGFVRACGTVAAPALLAAFTALLVACGGGGDNFSGTSGVSTGGEAPPTSSGPAPATYTLGGTISGLEQDGLVLTNGTDTLAVAQGATTFTMPVAVSAGSSYELGVQTQPAWGHCTVTGGSGMVQAAVSDIVVACSPSVQVTTVAGNGFFGTDDGTGADASFSYPQGIARLSTGDFFIADYSAGAGSIRKMTANGVVTTVPKGACTTPRNVAVDAQDNLYVVNVATTVCKITPQGVETPLDTSSHSPGFVVVDRSGNLFVGDVLENVIRKLTPSGDVSDFAVGIFTDLNAMAIDKDDNIYVADANKIRKITPQGEVSTVAGGDGSGNADGPVASATFYQPSGLAVASDGTVYVSDSGNNRIRMISSSGVVTTLAGGDDYGFTDGSGTQATFDYPAGLTLDAAGALYVVDKQNSAIRKISNEQ